MGNLKKALYKILFINNLLCAREEGIILLLSDLCEKKLLLTFKVKRIVINWHFGNKVCRYNLYGMQKEGMIVWDFKSYPKQMAQRCAYFYDICYM